MMDSKLQAIIANVTKNELILRIVKNSGYLFSATGISSAMSAFQSILAGRLLGPSVFGILGALTSFTSVVNRFASFRMNELVVKYVGHYQENQEQEKAAAVFKIASMLEFGSSIAAFLLIFFLAPVGARFFAHDVSLVFWFRLYGSIILANVFFESATGLLQIFDRFRVIALINVGQSCITLILVVIAYFMKSGLSSIVVAYMTGKIIGSLAISIIALIEAGKKWGKRWWSLPVRILKTEIRSLLTFAFSTNLSGTVSLIAKDSEVLWVSAFLGTQLAGYYKTALALTGLIQLPVSPLPQTTFPELAREIAKKNWENVRTVLRQGSRLAAFYSIPVSLVLILFGRWGISVTYGPDFIASYEPLIILLIGYTFVNIFYWNRVALLSFAHPVFPTIVNFVGMVIKVSLIFLIVPRWGYLAFSALLSGYYIFTVGIAAGRVIIDLRSRFAVQPSR